MHKWAKHAKQELHNNSHLGFLKKFRNRNYWHLNQHSVAAGLAAGVFAAFIPLPLQMLTAGIIALVVRGNILLAIAGTWITNPLTFIPINVFLLNVGNLMTTHDYINGLDVSNLDLETLKQLGKPFLIGTAVVSICASSTVFVLVYCLWGVISRKRKRK